MMCYTASFMKALNIEEMSIGVRQRSSILTIRRGEVNKYLLRRANVLSRRRFAY